MISQYLTSAYEIPFEPLSSGAVVRVYDEAGKVIETSTLASSKNGPSPIRKQTLLRNNYLMQNASERSQMLATL